MKLLLSLLAGLLACYVALVLASQYLGTFSSVACSEDFTLPGIVCRLSGGVLTLLLVPTAGLLAFVVARKLLGKQSS